MAMRSIYLTSAVILISFVVSAQSSEKAPAGFVTLFNGSDLTNWKIPVGDNGHWKVKDGVIDYDAESEAEDKNLWTGKKEETCRS